MRDGRRPRRRRASRRTSTSARTATPTPILADASVVLTDALKDGTGRFDASDLMPAAVGQGSFWTEMVNYVKNGPNYLETALQNIDKSWPAS